MNAAEIKAIRKQLCISQAELASLIKSSTAAVSAWENSLRVPKPNTVRAIQALVEKPTEQPADVMLHCKQLLAKAYNCTPENVNITITISG